MTTRAGRTNYLLEPAKIERSKRWTNDRIFKAKKTENITCIYNQCKNIIKISKANKQCIFIVKILGPYIRTRNKHGAILKVEFIFRLEGKVTRMNGYFTEAGITRELGWTHDDPRKRSNDGVDSQRSDSTRKDGGNKANRDDSSTGSGFLERPGTERGNGGTDRSSNSSASALAGYKDG